MAALRMDRFDQSCGSLAAMPRARSPWRIPMTWTSMRPKRLVIGVRSPTRNSRHGPRDRLARNCSSVTVPGDRSASTKIYARSKQRRTADRPTTVIPDWVPMAVNEAMPAASTLERSATPPELTWVPCRVVPSSVPDDHSSGRSATVSTSSSLTSSAQIRRLSWLVRNTASPMRISTPENNVP